MAGFSPLFGNPIALIKERCLGNRNKRGFGLPGFANSVTVPHITYPKPRVLKGLTNSQFLSYPADSPTGLASCMPHILIFRRTFLLLVVGTSTCHTDFCLNAKLDMLCATSAGKRKSSGRIRSLYSNVPKANIIRTAEPRVRKHVGGTFSTHYIR